MIANEKVEERSKSDETALPPKYEDEFKEAAFEEVTDENHNKENEVKPEVILPPMEVGGTWKMVLVVLDSNWVKV